MERADGVDLGQAMGVLDPQWVIFPPPELIWCLILLAYGGKIKGVRGYFGRNVALFWFYLN